MVVKVMIVRMIMRTVMRKYRSSRSQMFFKIGILKHFANFTGKHLCWSFFLMKLQALRPANLLKTDSNTDVLL